MSDVFDRLIGQSRAASQLRHHVRHPVHAYLVSGPAGSSVRDALVALAAGLQCPLSGCGECETCRLVLAGRDPDVTFAERAGASWRLEEIREIERVARRRPLGAGYQIVVIEDVELTVSGSSPSAPALLKSLEEPPPRTIYLLGAEDVPEELATIVSRCVRVHLRALSDDDLATLLQGDGVDSATARDAARAARGNVRRARVLVRDPGLSERVASWREVPRRLNGTPAVATTLASELSRALDDATAAFAELQRNDDDGPRGRDVDAQRKREQRRFRLDEVRFGLAALVDVYRERLHRSLEDVAEGDLRRERDVANSLRALDLVAGANERLNPSVDEYLLLNDLMLSLREL